MNVLLFSGSPDVQVTIEKALDVFFPNDLILTIKPSIEFTIEPFCGKSVDVIIVELLASGLSLDATSALLKRFSNNHPVIIIANSDNKSLATELVREGIQDYLIDTDLHPALLGKAINYAIERKQQSCRTDDHRGLIMSLLAKFSHDYSSHIRLIDAGISILQDDISTRLPLTEDENEWFDLMKQRAKLMDNQITDLVVYLKSIYRKPVSESIDLNELIESIDAQIRTERKLDFQLLVDRLPAFTGDRELLTQVFKAVIINGVTYNNNENPLITVRTLEQPHNGAVRIAIKDDGIGIEPCYYDSIFEPFCRLHKNSEFLGTGLGLSTAKTIVEQYQGSLTIDSRIGSGSEFVIALAEHTAASSGNIIGY